MQIEPRRLRGAARHHDRAWRCLARMRRPAAPGRLVTRCSSLAVGVVAFVASAPASAEGGGGDIKQPWQP
jgi:hypothetical protein